MKRNIFFALIFTTAFVVHAAEEAPKEPRVLVIKDEKSFDEHFKNQVLGKQMAPQVLSKPAKSLEQVVPLIKAEASMLSPMVYMTEYKDWFLFSDGATVPQSKVDGLDPIRVFFHGYAIKKGTAKLILFGYCW